VTKSEARRILHVYQSPSYSGAEAYAKEFAEYHHRSGHEVSFLARSASPLAQRLQGERLTEIFESPDEVDWRSFDVIILHSTQELKSLKWRLAKLRLFANSEPGPTPGRAGRRPLIVLYSHIWISHSKRDPLHALAYSLIDQFWCSSNASKAVLEKFLPLAKDKIKVVRYGRNIGELQKRFLTKAEARSRLQIPTQAQVFGTLSRVDAGKGSRELWNSALKVLRARPDTHFLMIGPATASDPKAVKLDAELEAELAAIKQNEPAIGNRITKLGRLENGTDYLPAFDLFILATYKENFALTLLEAQLAGVPCLGTNSGGTPDLVKPPETGWLFEPENESSLTAALTQALGDQARWPEIATQSRDNILKSYDFPKVMKEADHVLFGPA
jgi:glycosyltransferase involved in cell wall biosynthesis